MPILPFPYTVPQYSSLCPLSILSFLSSAIVMGRMVEYPPSSYVEDLIHNVAIIGDGAFKEFKLK
jgi:hypothetical protein